MGARGWWIVTSAALAIAIGAWLSWSELVAIGVGLAVLVLIALRLRRPRSASWADESAPVRVVRGDPAALAISVSVTGGPTRWVSAVDSSGTDRVFLPFESSGTLTWPINTARRGLFEVGPTVLEVGDPFGIRRTVLASREPSPVLVVPRVHPVDALPSPAALTEGSEERAGSESFHSIREYVVGDPMKLVHWKASARTGTMMVRRMVDTTTPWLVIILDVNARAYDRTASMFEDFDPEEFERAVDMAASYAWHGSGPARRVLMTTTALASSGAPLVEVTGRDRASALDWLATISILPSASCGPARVAAILGRQGVTGAILVTGARRATSESWVATWRPQVSVTVVGGSA